MITILKKYINKYESYDIRVIQLGDDLKKLNQKLCVEESKLIILIKLKF